MGMFLSMTGVIGKTKDEVVNSLSNYTKSVAGGLEKASLPAEHDNCCVIEEANGHTTIFNPYAYTEWDSSSEFISRDLNAPVFSFHIHDGDFWMYVLYVNGEVADQFNPIPDYWDNNISEEEMQSWKGNAAVVCNYVTSVKPAEIENYLVRWDWESEESKKAYPQDEFTQEDWQLLDFMKKIKLPYPLDDDGNAKGETYRIWTKALTLKPMSSTIQKRPTNLPHNNQEKPWWKFW